MPKPATKTSTTTTTIQVIQYFRTFFFNYRTVVNQRENVNEVLLNVLSLQMFNLYIKQAAEIFGVTHTREIYEKAIEVLPNEQSR